MYQDMLKLVLAALNNADEDRKHLADVLPDLLPKFDANIQLMRVAAIDLKAAVTGMTDILEKARKKKEENDKK